MASFSQSDSTALRQVLRSQLSVGAPELTARLGISQPTLARRIVADASIVRLGKARASRYALAQNVRNMGNSWPLYRVDADAQLERVGVLHALAYQQQGMALTMERDVPALRVGEFAVGKDAVYPDLPWWLDDQRPQGFLGRALAKSLPPSLQLPQNILRWQRDDVLQALLSAGHDAIGNWILGEYNAQQALRSIQQPTPAIRREDRPQQFVRLAEQALAGELVGSSAGGEQPKFLTRVEDAEGVTQHCIVKFTERLESPAARRWANLLRCEHIALEVLRTHGFPAAQSEIVEGGGRVFLQTTRFDRTAVGGRYGVVSLAAFDAAYLGMGGASWWQVAPRMQQLGWLGAEDAQRLSVIGWFGELIANTDMHFGNVSFYLDDQQPLRLAPVYDMLPMLYRPSPQGEIVERNFGPVLPLPEQREAYAQAAMMAREFWASVENQVGNDCGLLAPKL